MRVPKSANEITIAQYQEAEKILKSTEGIERNIQLIALFTGKTIQEVEALKLPEIADTVKSLKFLEKMDDLKAEPNRYFYIDSQRYSVILDVKKLTGGQFIDLTTYCKGGRIVENMHNILATLSYTGKKYTHEGFEARAELIKDKVKLATVWPIVVFFWVVWLEYLSNIQTYLKREEMMTKN